VRRYRYPNTGVLDVALGLEVLFCVTAALLATVGLMFSAAGSTNPQSVDTRQELPVRSQFAVLAVAGPESADEVQAGE
jgi:hypothetical protein